MRRVTCLFPAATEIAFGIGAGDQVVGVSHACDHPPTAREKKVVTRARFDQKELSSRAIYNQKVENNTRFGSIFRLDESALWGLRTETMITQGPSDFALISLQGVRAIAEGLNPRPEVVSLYPRHLDDVLDDHVRVGLAAGQLYEARALVEGVRKRIKAVQAEVSGARRLHVAFVQWLDPSFAGGYWIPQLIEIAAGVDALGTPGLSPNRFHWPDLRRQDPDVVVVACEELSLERARSEMRLLTDRPGWGALSAVRRNRVYVGDGRVFTRGGPRVIDALEALAWAVHPDRFPAPAPEALQLFGA